MSPVNGKEYPTVTDLKPPSAIEGNYVQMKDLEGQQLLIQGVKSLGRKPSPKGELVETAVVKARAKDGALIFFYTSHVVLLGKIVYCFSQAPGGFLAKIIKKGRYYDIE